MWFYKKHLDKFFIQTRISVLKKKLLKIYFHLKDNKNYVGGFYIKSILYVYQTLNEITMKKKVCYNWACNLIFELQ